MPYHYTYPAYVLLPEIVRREFSVQEIRLLRLCPVGTLPARDPDVSAVPRIRMPFAEACLVCGIVFQREILSTEEYYEKETCGSLRCVAALGKWLVHAAPLTRGAKNSEEELLTFLGSSLYHFLRKKWLSDHKIKTPTEKT